MNLAHWLERTAATAPEAPAVFLGTKRLRSYGDLARRASAIAASLRELHDVRPGDRVALVLPNHPEYLELMFAVWWAGGVIVPVNYKLHAREAAWIITNAEAKVSFASPDLAADLASALPEGFAQSILVRGEAAFERLSVSAGGPPVRRGMDDLAWLFYTSGTTGRPKGAMLSHGALVAMSLTYLRDVDTVSAQDTAYYAAPMSHGAGLYSLVHVLHGAGHAFPTSKGFDAEEVLSDAAKLGSVSMFAAPTMVRRLTIAVKAGGSAHGIRTIVYGGGPMYLADIVEAVESMGPRLVQMYGQGESPMTITALSRERVADRGHPRWRERLASVGLPQACVEVRTVTEDGQDARPGETGEVVVRGATVMQGYWRDEATTERALRNGWLHTGDMGAFDADGYLTLLDRSKDVIISGGSNIYPREVEEVLLSHPGVAEVSVVGRPHPDWGEEVVAFVVPVPGGAVDEAELDAACVAQIARFKRPKTYFVLQELPKNNYGKVLKTVLRDLLNQREGASND